jgi:hypothetical protein
MVIQLIDENTSRHMGPQKKNMVSIELQSQTEFIELTDWSKGDRG